MFLNRPDLEKCCYHGICALNRKEKMPVFFFEMLLTKKNPTLCHGMCVFTKSHQCIVDAVI